MPDTLFLRQKSMWNGFAFEFSNSNDSADPAIGSMAFANFAQAKNARLKVHPPGSTAGDCQIQLGTEPFLFRFEYTRRGFVNDVRYTLETPKGELLCTADVVYQAGKRHPALRLTHPLQLEVMPSTSFWTKRFPMVNTSGTEVGVVHEPCALALRFAYGLHLPEASRPVQAFLLVATYLVRH